MVWGLVLPLLAAIFLAVNMGGSGVAAAFSSSYNANLIKKDYIPLFFGVCVLIGAVSAGSKVTTTIGGGVLDTSIFSSTITTIVLVSIGLSILVANLLKVPQSTSQATVFSLMGVGTVSGQMDTTNLFTTIMPAWLILPVIAFVITYLFAKYVYGPLQEKKLIDFLKFEKCPFIKYSAILGSCFVAFSIGANNVANASGPLLSLIYNVLDVSKGSEMTILVSILLIAPWFGVGSLLFKDRVLEGSNKSIVHFGPLGALSMSLLIGCLLTVSSLSQGIPAALAQINIGALLGLAAYKEGFKKTFSKKAVGRVFIVWIVAPIIAYFVSLGLCISFYKMFVTVSYDIPLIKNDKG